MSFQEKKTEKLDRFDVSPDTNDVSPDTGEATRADSLPEGTFFEKPKKTTTLSGEEDLKSQPLIIGERWRILQRLGEGGMSVVYKARHVHIDKVVAIKVLLPHLTSNAKNVARFQQEAKAAGTLNHPNVVKVDDFGLTADNRTYMIMEFLEGRSLSELIAEDGKLDPMRALFIFVQATNALSHAHEKGIIHRDLKPSNLMLVPDEEQGEIVKIVDFGIAKLMGEGDEAVQNLTQTGEVFGSPLYMSPEQCRGQKLDGRSDIYSMGCLIYETLTGDPPIKGSNILDTMHKQIREIPVPIVPDQAPDSLLKRLNAITMKCLEKEPEDRYQTMVELEQDLNRALLTAEKDWKHRAKSLKKLIKRPPQQMAHQRLTLTIIAASIVLVCIVSYVSAFVLYSPEGSVEVEPESLWTNISAIQVVERPDYFETRTKADVLESRVYQPIKELINKPELTPEEKEILQDSIGALTVEARYLKQNGKLDTAGRVYQKVIELCQKLNLADSSTAASVYRNLADIYTVHGQYKEAYNVISKCIPIMERTTPNRSELIEPQIAMEKLESKMGYLATAQSSCDKLINLFTALSTTKQPGLLERNYFGEWRPKARYFFSYYTSERADLLRRQHEYTKAEQEYTRSIVCWRNLLNARSISSDNLTKALYGLGLVQVHLGKVNEAAQTLKEARDLAKNSSLEPDLRKKIRNSYLAVERKNNPLNWLIVSIQG